MWTLEWPTVGKAVGCLELLAGWLLHSLVCVPLPMLKGTQYFQAVHAAQCAAMLSSPASALTLLPAPVPRAETVPLNDENYLLPFWMVWAVGVAGLTEQCSRVEWKAAICSGRRVRGSSRPSPACLLSRGACLPHSNRSCPAAPAGAHSICLFLGHCLCGVALLRLHR